VTLSRLSGGPSGIVCDGFQIKRAARREYSASSFARVDQFPRGSLADYENPADFLALFILQNLAV